MIALRSQYESEARVLVRKRVYPGGEKCESMMGTLMEGAMAPFSNLLIALADVPDPRRAQGKRYPLPHLLLFTVLALLSGARSYRGVITFLEQRRQHLNDHFAVALKRAPAVNTLRTVLQSVSTEALEQAFRRHAEGLLPRPRPAKGL